MNGLVALAIGVLVGVGVFQILQRDPLRLLIGLGLWSNALNLFLLAMGAQSGSSAPYAGAPSPTSDPLPQALVLTAIVISLAAIAFVVALLRRLADRHGAGDLDLARELRR